MIVWSRGEASKIAVEILRDLPDKLDAEQGEMLGDLFLELRMDKEAEEAFRLAAKRLTD